MEHEISPNTMVSVELTDNGFGILRESRGAAFSIEGRCIKCEFWVLIRIFGAHIRPELFSPFMSGIRFETETKPEPKPKPKRELPRYRSSKEVRALKVKAVWPETQLEYPWGVKFMVEPADMPDLRIRVSQQFWIQWKAEPGGYYVLYEDGYESYSPAKAFEEGYTRLL